MIANYHTHTARCQHATGTEEEYVRRALEGGLQILGFSDHAPYPFHSNIRMAPEETGEYIETVLALREKYADKLQIRLGFEAECYPGSFEELVRRLRDTPVEYLILGQHWLGPNDERYNGRPTDAEEHLRMYCDQVIDAMYTGEFTYVAHPDIVHYTGEDKIYRAHMKRLCQAAKQCGLPLEINLLGLGGGRQYPRRLFWEIAAEEGNQVILGSDAHEPAGVWVPETEKRALEMVEDLGLELLQTVQLRKI